MSTFKKCKVLLLPTNEKASLIYGNSLLNKLSYGELSPSHCSHYHLYIISDDKIEEGEICWVLNTTNNSIFLNNPENGKIAPPKINILHKEYNKEHFKKIITTTDTSLKIIKKTNNPALTEHINNGYVSSTYEDILPQPSQGFIKIFIEEYNKGNVITDVMVEYETKVVGYEVGFTGDIDISEEVVKINSKDNTITIKKLKDSWNKCEHAANLIKYRQDYEQFKKDSHFGPNQREIEEWSNKWIEENL